MKAEFIDAHPLKRPPPPNWVKSTSYYKASARAAKQFPDIGPSSAESAMDEFPWKLVSLSHAVPGAVVLPFDPTVAEARNLDDRKHTVAIANRHIPAYLSHYYFEAEAGPNDSFFIGFVQCETRNRVIEANSRKPSSQPRRTSGPSGPETKRAAPGGSAFDEFEQRRNALVSQLIAQAQPPLDNDGVLMSDMDRDPDEDEFERRFFHEPEARNEDEAEDDDDEDDDSGSEMEGLDDDDDDDEELEDEYESASEEDVHVGFDMNVDVEVEDETEEDPEDLEHDLFDVDPDLRAEDSDTLRARAVGILPGSNVVIRPDGSIHRSLFDKHRVLYDRRPDRGIDDVFVVPLQPGLPSPFFVWDPVERHAISPDKVLMLRKSRRNLRADSPTQRFGIVLNRADHCVRFVVNGVLLPDKVHCSFPQENGNLFPVILMKSGKCRLHFGDGSQADDGFEFGIRQYVQKVEDDALIRKHVKMQPASERSGSYLEVGLTRKPQIDVAWTNEQIQKYMALYGYDGLPSFARILRGIFCDGHPADLPPLVSRLPLDLATYFQFEIYIFMKYALSRGDDVSARYMRQGALAIARDLAQAELDEEDRQTLTRAVTVLFTQEPRPADVAALYSPEFNSRLLRSLLEAAKWPEH